MSEFIQTASSVNWWLSVVVVGLPLNLVSSYLKAPLDAMGDRLSSAWKRRSDAAREKLRVAAERLLADPEAMAAARYDALRLRAKSTWWLVFLGIATTLYGSDLYLRAIEAVFGQKLPQPEYFTPDARFFFLLLLLFAAVKAMSSAFSADDAEALIRRAEANR